MKIMDKTKHVKKVQELHEQLSSVYSELAEALSLQSMYEDLWWKEREENKELRNKISTLERPEVEIIELKSEQEKTTSTSGGSNK